MLKQLQIVVVRKRVWCDAEAGILSPLAKRELERERSGEVQNRDERVV